MPRLQIRRIAWIILTAMPFLALVPGCKKPAADQPGKTAGRALSRNIPRAAETGLLALFAALAAFFMIKSRRIARVEKLIKKRASELELQNAILDTLFDSIPDLIFIKSLDLRYIHCSKSMLRHLDIRREDIIGKNNTELGLSGDLAGKYDEGDQKIISGSQTIVCEEHIPHVDGTIPLYETIKTPLIMNGAVAGILGISRNITKRKKLEDLLEKQNSLANAVITSHRGIIWSVDSNGIITTFKGQYLKTIGITSSFLEGKHIGLARKKSSHLDIVRSIEKTFSEGPQEWISDINGGIFHSYTTPLYDSKGNVVGVAGITNDQTALFKLQRELEAALEAAKIANQTKTNFLANMSHEIRTPMNSIIGFSELAMDGNNPPKTRDYLRKILENSKWLLQIINDVLDISKIESGRMELERIPFDLHELFAACRTIIMPAVEEKGLNLHFYSEPSIGKRLIGDPTKLRQALLNLLANAVKFTKTGIIKLSAAVKDMAAGSVTVHFEVKDSGIGMAPEQLARIFEPFMQADETTTRKYGGTGLGLAITKNIVEMMGGKLVVESTPDVGSTFGFEIAFEARDAEDDSITDEIVFDASEGPLFNGEVLVCEDNRMNQEVICEHLNRAGLSTVIAWNGKEGLEIVRARMEKGEKPFDMIFMDIHMPVMDGFEAAPLMAAMGIGAPIVAITANVMTNDRMLYRQYGMPDCLGKPFTTQELWRCLLKYLTPVGNRTVTRAESDQANEELHKRLLVDFVTCYRNTFKDINKAMDEGDAKLAHRLTHSLKGAAGMIGRIGLWEAARDVEQALATGEIGLAREPLYILKPLLRETLNEIESLLDVIQSQAAQPSKALDAPQALGLLEKLEPLLKANNLECLKIIDDLRAIEGSDLLIRQIEDFDFMPALETLVGIKQALEAQS